MWVLADTTGYTLDIDVYTGKSVDRSDHGVAFDVIMKLVEPLAKSLQPVHFELNVVVSSKIYYASRQHSTCMDFPKGQAITFVMVRLFTAGMTHEQLQLWQLPTLVTVSTM